MSPVFRHGRLRLYLLKLLDESPRHGYEVIRLLQDRFMGVYAPSPGTIYPRLARLEEEGLVTHDETAGRKVYRITDKGREELRNRSGDLSELEEEITASVRDIAREVTEDVRETVRNLREELTFAAHDMYRHSHGDPGARENAARARYGGRARARSEWDIADQEAEAADQAARDRAGQPETAPAGPARADRDQAQRQRHEARGHEARDRARAEAHQDREEARQQRREARGRGARDQGDWDQDWAGSGGGRRGRGGRDWPPWADRAGWGGWPSRPGWADPGTYRDLEQLARHFSKELRDAASAAQAVSEEAVGDLRTILDDALDRIKAEVFSAPGPHRPSRPGAPDAPDAPPRPDSPLEPGSSARPDAPPTPDTPAGPGSSTRPDAPPTPDTPAGPGSSTGADTPPGSDAPR